jgi:ComF family protein
VNYGVYDGTLRRLIHMLKYERVRSAAGPLGRLAAEACLQLEGDINVEELLLIPVPTHKLRMRSRGFNQAELIARAAHRGMEQAIGCKLTLDLTSLLRVRFADSQVALSGDERRQQIHGAFKVTSRERIKGREILLVDDVLTTGATASECARELRQAGASRVWVVTPARALVRMEQEAAERGNSLLETGSSSSDRLSSSQSSFSKTSVSPQFSSKSWSGPSQGTLLQRRSILSNYGEQRVGWNALRARLL